MNINNRHLKAWCFHVLIWMGVTLLMTWATLSSIRSIITYLNIEESIYQNEIATYVVSDYQYLESTLFGFLIGTIFFIINFFLDRWKSLHNVTFVQIVLYKSVLYIIGLLIVFWLIATLLINFGIAPRDIFDTYMEQNVLIPIFPPIMLLFTALIILINLFQQIDRMFGPGKLWKIFTGKYFHPKAEDRIFMFLDLKSSTTIAENLGHIKYSKFLQQCFRLLNKAVIPYQTEIYQYVGDEIVLTWPDNSRNRKNTIAAFYSIEDAILKKEKNFLNEFGHIPVFKAGINAGSVTVAEVGSIKSEICYHGDAINTASRVQHLCNSYKCKLLITHDALPSEEFSSLFCIQNLGNVKLEGKQNEIALYQVKKQKSDS